MDGPQLVRVNALAGTTVGISVSDSADLARLGLSPAHCEVAVAELARAIFVAGGTIVYGGRLVPAGFTDVLLTELGSYRQDRQALILCVPETEHRRVSKSELLRRQAGLQSNAELICLDSSGEPIDIRYRPRPPRNLDPAIALTGMRRHITDRCDARVIIGGKLTNYQGALPGILEEASMSLQAAQPLYVAGGFGGAAAALAIALRRADASSAPNDYPEGAAEHVDEIAEIARAEKSVGRADDGLSNDQRSELAWSHRPGEIASIVVYGLSRRSA
jgi:hypothetical protein